MHFVRQLVMGHMGTVSHVLGQKERHAECVVAAQHDHRCVSAVGLCAPLTAGLSRGRRPYCTQHKAHELRAPRKARECVVTLLLNLTLRFMVKALPDVAMGYRWALQ